MNRLPVIAIVGRPNVGKSSLLNALVGKRISIVQDMPGVTRDRVTAHLRIDDRYVELVDTGGYGFVDPDALTDHIRQQIEIAMARADLVLFVVDCEQGLTSADEEIAAMLRRKSIKTALVANKADGEKADVSLGEFARLGLGTPIGVSALRERKLDQVFTAIEKNVDLRKAPKEVPPPEMMVAIVGKRNAGKSTLVNSIAGVYEGDPNRVIVSEVPGTTRDSVDVRFTKEGKTLTVIDTAGVRKKRHMMTNDIEFYSFHRAERSIRRADVVLMLIDATIEISEPDKKLANYISEQFKPIIFVVNKWDLAREMIRQRRKGGEDLRDEDIMEEYRNYLNEELRHLDYAPMVFITAKDGKNVQIVIDLAQHLFKQTNERVTTAKVNQAVRQILAERQPSTPSGRRARIYYATQIEVAPPTIVLFVNNPDYFDQAYTRFIINRMRDILPYPEVPIRLVVRQREQRSTEGQGLSLGDDDDGQTRPSQSRVGAANGKKMAGPRSRSRSRSQNRCRPRRKGAAQLKRVWFEKENAKLIGMKAHTKYLTFNTKKNREYINITAEVESAVSNAAIREGMVLVSAMHITAGVFVNDNESGFLKDLDDFLERLAPQNANYRHHQTGETNGHAHLKNIVVHHQVILPITNGTLDLGPWQQVFYAEFDGQRPKRLVIKVMGE